VPQRSSVASGILPLFRLWLAVSQRYNEGGCGTSAMKQFSLSGLLIVVSLVGIGSAIFGTDGCKDPRFGRAAEAAAKVQQADIEKEKRTDAAW